MAAKDDTLGYVDALSVRRGADLVLRASAATDRLTLSLVRIVGVDWGAGGVQPRLDPVSGTQRLVAASVQTVSPGSQAQAPLPRAIARSDRIGLDLTLLATAKRDAAQTILSLGPGVGLELDAAGHLVWRAAGQHLRSHARMRRRGWIGVHATAGPGGVSLSLRPAGDWPDGGPRIAPEDQSVPASTFDPATLDRLRLGAGTDGGGAFDGRIGTVTLSDARGLLARWHPGRDPATDRLADSGPSACHGRVSGAPDRAVRAAAWTGAEDDPRRAPAAYDAAHFHADGVGDAGWSETARIATEALPAGLLAVRLEDADGRTDLVPFVLRPERPRHRLAFLLPTFTYLSYANAPPAMRGPDYGLACPAEAVLARHPEVGRSQYERHGDGAPVMLSTLRRPLLTMRFGLRPWGLPVDATTMAWLADEGFGHDVLTDHDLHHQGLDALHGYDVLVTGNHPEYHSAQTRAALAAFTAQGGRLVYLGGNGFYWRVTLSDDVMEVRRAEGGTRPWAADPGEAHHAQDGRRGGLWRRLGAPPQALAGVGFAAQGAFETAAHYRLAAGAREGAAAFVTEGVDDVFGTVGRLGGGAAGQEIDRVDARLGTPETAIRIAASEGHDPAMMRTVEEMLSSVPPFDDPGARSDVVLVPLDHGGAIFAAGSMAWAGALGVDPGVSRMTRNVLTRFLDPAPLA
ncbi:MAG: N,N-dimethylformamidase beta subunit family domain-containing protein [Pseudomonadota bacterium]